MHTAQEQFQQDATTDAEAARSPFENKGSISGYVEDYSEIKLVNTMREACEATGSSPATMYREINDGKIIASKIQGKTVFLREHLIAYLQALPRVKAA